MSTTAPLAGGLDSTDEFTLARPDRFLAPRPS